MLVTMLVILFGMAVYAGMGYLVVKESDKLNVKLWHLLCDREMELEDENIYGFCLVDEYNEKTTIRIFNNVIRWTVIVACLLVWPISATAACLLKYGVYRRLMKTVARF